MKSLPSTELELLLNAVADCTIDEAGEQSLASLLKRDATARRHYLDFMAMHAALHWDYVQSSVRPLAVPAPKRASMRWLWVAAAAATLAFWIGVNWQPVPDKTPPVAETAVASRAVAVLTTSANAQWQDHDRQSGQGLVPGWLKLKSGAVQLEFSRGARVLLEGPAEFQLVSNNEGYLRRGKLRANVPESAHGFTIRAEHFSVVDHGTEFGCVVPATGEAEVHVLSGRVGVMPTRGMEQMLAKAESVSLSAGLVRRIPERPNLFMGDAEFARIASGQASTQLTAWRQASIALSGHPAALVHYDFEQVRDLARVLPNGVKGRDLPASIVGCEAADGRWPGKGALEFKGKDDRLRFTVPGELKALTLLAWVRVDALTNGQNSLLMGESELPGEAHWYFRKNGALGLGIISPKGHWEDVSSSVALKNENLGTWVFVVTTFDGATTEVRHYFNGKLLAAKPLTEVHTVRLRTVEVGNWGVPVGAPLRASTWVKDVSGYIRNLQGRVDEFALFSTVLSGSEIQRLYNQGSPSPSH